MRRGNASPISVQNLRAREREARCLELLKAGATYDQIADALAYKDASGAWRAAMRALARIPAPAAAELRRIDGERCERLLFSLRTRIERGEPRAVEAGIRVLQHKARLNGYMAPEHHEISGSVDKALGYDDAQDPLLAAAMQDPEVLEAFQKFFGRQEALANAPAALPAPPFDPDANGHGGNGGPPADSKGANNPGTLQ